MDYWIPERGGETVVHDILSRHLGDQAAGISAIIYANRLTGSHKWYLNLEDRIELIDMINQALIESQKEGGIRSVSATLLQKQLRHHLAKVPQEDITTHGIHLLPIISELATQSEELQNQYHNNAPIPALIAMATGLGEAVKLRNEIIPETDLELARAMNTSEDDIRQMWQVALLRHYSDVHLACFINGDLRLDQQGEPNLSRQAVRVLQRGISPGPLSLMACLKRLKGSYEANLLSYWQLSTLINQAARQRAGLSWYTWQEERQHLGPEQAMWTRQLFKALLWPQSNSYHERRKALKERVTNMPPQLQMHLAEYASDNKMANLISMEQVRPLLKEQELARFDLILQGFTNASKEYSHPKRRTRINMECVTHLQEELGLK